MTFSPPSHENLTDVFQKDFQYQQLRAQAFRVARRPTPWRFSRIFAIALGGAIVCSLFVVLWTSRRSAHVASPTPQLAMDASSPSSEKPSVLAPFSPVDVVAAEKTRWERAPTDAMRVMVTTEYPKTQNIADFYAGVDVAAVSPEEWSSLEQIRGEYLSRTAVPKEIYLGSKDGSVARYTYTESGVVHSLDLQFVESPGVFHTYSRIPEEFSGGEGATGSTNERIICSPVDNPGGNFAIDFILNTDVNIDQYPELFREAAIPFFDSFGGANRGKIGEIGGELFYDSFINKLLAKNITKFEKRQEDDHVVFTKRYSFPRSKMPGNEDRDGLYRYLDTIAQPYASLKYDAQKQLSAVETGIISQGKKYIDARTTYQVEYRGSQAEMKQQSLAEIAKGSYHSEYTYPSGQCGLGPRLIPEVAVVFQKYHDNLFDSIDPLVLSPGIIAARRGLVLEMLGLVGKRVLTQAEAENYLSGYEFFWKEYR
jgi:hypothetical protein